MKKLFAILLALAMIFAMSATVFAEDEATTTLNITDGHTYDGYKLLNVTTSVKAGDNCGEGNHNKDCYTYSYSVNNKYLDILKTATGKNTAEDIIEYLSELDDAEMRTLADALHKAIVGADGIDADATNLTNESAIVQGYWLFADVTDVDEAYKAKSLAIVNTAGLEDLTITAKTGLPTIEKKVEEKDDTNGTTAWGDEADHDIGDAVSFKLTATLHDEFENYETYKLVFHDTLAAGLTLDTNSFEVTIDDNAVEDAFVYAAGQNGAFTLTCNNARALQGVTKDSVIVVTYTATLNENAVIGGAGNTNTVQLEFSNDPYSNSTGKTEEDTVTVYTYQLIVNKTDGTNPLAGAEFKLEKLVNGNYEEVGNPTLGENGTQFVWAGLDAGTYRLTETEAPAGYNKAAPEVIDFDADTDPVKVVNRTGSVLPETGAQGTFMLIGGGTLLVILAAVFMITRKKMSIFED